MVTIIIQVMINLCVSFLKKITSYFLYFEWKWKFEKQMFDEQRIEIVFENGKD